MAMPISRLLPMVQLRPAASATAAILRAGPAAAFADVDRNDVGCPRAHHAHRVLHAKHALVRHDRDTEPGGVRRPSRRRRVARPAVRRRRCRTRQSTDGLDGDARRPASVRVHAQPHLRPIAWRTARTRATSASGSMPTLTFIARNPCSTAQAAMSAAATGSGPETENLVVT